MKIKFGFSGHESEFLDESDEITGETDVLSLFTPDFMSHYTKFDNLVDFIAASGQDFTSQDSWNSIQNGEIDSFIQQNSDFDSWEDMYTTAGNEFLQKALT